MTTEGTLDATKSDGVPGRSGQMIYESRDRRFELPEADHEDLGQQSGDEGEVTDEEDGADNEAKTVRAVKNDLIVKHHFNMEKYADYVRLDGNEPWGARV